MDLWLGYDVHASEHVGLGFSSSTPPGCPWNFGPGEWQSRDDLFSIAAPIGAVEQMEGGCRMLEDVDS